MSCHQDTCVIILIFSWNTLSGLQTHNPLSFPKSFLNSPNIFHDLQETSKLSSLSTSSVLHHYLFRSVNAFCNSPISNLHAQPCAFGLRMFQEYPLIFFQQQGVSGMLSATSPETLDFIGVWGESPVSWQWAQNHRAESQGHSFVWYHPAVCRAKNPPGKNPALPAAIGCPILHAELDTFSQEISSSCPENSIPSRGEYPIKRSNEEKLKLVVPLAYSSDMPAGSFTMHTEGQSSCWLIKNRRIRVKCSYLLF